MIDQKMTKKIIVTSLFLALIITVSNAQMVKSKAFNILLKNMLAHSVTEITVAQADSLKKENALFIDTREREEYSVSHIDNAIFVGYDSLDLSPLEKVAKDEKIVVYCAVGYRSEKTAEKLVKLGYTNVHNLYGGIFEWKNQDKTVVNPGSEETEKVHAYNRIWGVWLQKGEKVY